MAELLWVLGNADAKFGQEGLQIRGRQPHHTSGTADEPGHWPESPVLKAVCTRFVQGITCCYISHDLLITVAAHIHSGRIDPAA